MPRERMYLCERAYSDYLATVDRFAGGLQRGSFGVWHWFWAGPPVSIFRIVLFFSAAALAVLSTSLLIVYDFRQSHGLSLRAAATSAVVFAFVALALWGWIPMLHLLARGVAGLCGMLLVITLASAPFTAGFVVLVIYLAVLICLTGMICIIALPVRASQEAWLLYRKITYSCPYGCGYRGLPIHVAKTGEQIADLLPSTYGILYHRLYEGKEMIKLPTMDLLGRNKLDRLCGRCRNPLIHSSFGEMPEHPIVIVGGPNAGKTVFLRQAIREFIKLVRARPRGVARVDSQAQERELQKDYADLDKGLVMPKTAGVVSHAFGLAVSVPKRLKKLVYLFDAPGEDFARMDRFGRKQVVRHLAGIVLLVDPFSLPAFEDRQDDLDLELKPSPAGLYSVATILIKGLDQLLLERPDQKCNVPLAIVLAKADAYPTREFPCLKGLCQSSGEPHTDEIAARCRSALEQLGESRSIRALEQKFSKVQYFACSALGRLPKPGDSSPFVPRGVVEPFLWLLGLGPK